MKMRLGYVSNSSSSSFVLSDRKDIGRAVELFKEFVPEDYSSGGINKDVLVKLFESEASKNNDFVSYDMECHLASLCWSFQNFYESYLSLRKSRLAFHDVKAYEVERMNELRIDFLDEYRSNPLGKRLSPLILETKKYIEKNIEFVDTGNGYYGRVPYMAKRDGNLIDGLYKKLSDEWTSENPNAVTMEFASDGDEIGGADIRCMLYDFYKYCKEKGIVCFITDNS